MIAAVGLAGLAACGQKDDASQEGDGGVEPGAATTAPDETTVPDSTTGVSDTEIRIGVHGPLTGAGAPAASFTKAADLYWRALGAGVHDRSVKVFLEDDKYNPSGAVAACKKMVEQDQVFLIYGAAGADQLAACAKYTNSVGVPYISEGIAEQGFDFDTYFATTPTYGQQGRILAEYIANVLEKRRVIMIRANTANFDEAEEGMRASASDNDLDFDAITIPKDASAPEVQSAAVQVCRERPEVVYPLMAPAIFLPLAAAVKGQGCTPRWAGVGNTMAINLVAQVGCGQDTLGGGASFFASYPGLDKVQELDAGYEEAYQQLNGSSGDDIGWGLWGAMKSLHTVLDGVGPDLSRQKLMDYIDGRSFPDEILPATDFTDSHFGGTGVHVLKVDCAADPPQWKTEYAFAKGF
jgi:ABC-type branched-subunit amino acid transport system substrate-binding protein